MEGANRPKMSLSERLARVVKIEERFGVQNLVDIVMELTENTELDVSELGHNMRSAVLRVLLMDSQPHPRPTFIVDHINLLLNQRRMRMGLLKAIQYEEAVDKARSSIQRRIIPTLHGYQKPVDSETTVTVGEDWIEVDDDWVKDGKDK